MSAEPTELWPWLALVGLGFFHGINPTMGWLFAVALGLHRRSFRTVLLSLVPIALGHTTAIALVLVAALALGLVFDHVIAGRVAAVILIGWALWHAVRGHRQRLRVGMQTGLVGLAVWSCFVATAHGAGLMLIPVLMPICLSGTPSQHSLSPDPSQSGLRRSGCTQARCWRQSVWSPSLSTNGSGSPSYGPTGSTSISSGSRR